MTVVIPNIDWYTAISRDRQVATRCPFATVEACPRYYQSLSLLGEAGSTRIAAEEDERLLEKWKKSDLWPKTAEQSTSISGPEGEPHLFANFCPEVAFDRFDYFAVYLARYADAIDLDTAHTQLGKEKAVQGDWRWGWSGITSMHYTDCPLYSVLAHRSASPPAPEIVRWYKRFATEIIIGVVIIVLGGLILMQFA